jgi:UDP-N-acetylglucosamine acyltransferase
MGARIHPTACVDPRAVLDDSVEVGPFAVVEPGVEVGPGCVIHGHSYLVTGARLGRNCRVFPFASVGAEPQDTKYRGQETCAWLGDGVTVREHACIERGNGQDQDTRVGDGCLIMTHTLVAHNCQLAAGVVLALGAKLCGHVRVGERAYIGASAVVHQFVQIGRGSMLSLGSRFTRDVPPFVIADGIDKIRQLNLVGIQRNPNLTRADLEQLKAAFRILYRKNLTRREALDALKAQPASGVVGDLIAFYERTTTRGFCEYEPTRRA